MKHAMAVFFILMVACYAMADPLPPAGMHRPAVEKPAGGHSGGPPDAIRFFQRHISSIDGDRCPMYPSCSSYGLDAFEKHGLLMGWIMTCDRLLRCGRDELTLAPRVMIDSEIHCYDPVEQNDFWWTD